MADILRLSGICVLGLCAALLLREKNTVFALLCAAAAVVAVALYILEGSALTAVQANGFFRLCNDSVKGAGNRIYLCLYSRTM